jgi:hypothetical protein
MVSPLSDPRREVVLGGDEQRYLAASKPSFELGVVGKASVAVKGWGELLLQHGAGQNPERGVTCNG